MTDPGGASSLAAHIREVPDFPSPGIGFKDITPLLGDAGAFGAAIDALVRQVEDLGVDRVVGIEARGLILAAPVACSLGVGFAPVRKPGKLPWETEGEEYSLEYGTDRVEIHRDGVRPGERVLVVDDVIATGGTAAATARLVEKLGAEVVGLAFLVELAFLGGRDRLPGYEVISLIRYSS